MNKIEISIITPSKNMLFHLKSCVASVVDQKEVNYEHIIIDGQSTDGTVEWLIGQSDLTFVSESDDGMYSAINKGMKMAKGNVLAYLNCDEQYLPDTLLYVMDFFNKYPEIDFIYGDALVVNNLGDIVAFKKAYNLRLRYLQASTLYIQTCSLFFRRKIIDNRIFFDPKYKSAGDAYFVEKMLKCGMKGRHVRRYLSTFTLTGKNLCLSDEGKRELKDWQNRGFIMRLLRIPLTFCQQIEKLLEGVFWEKMPIRYSIYTSDEKDKRKEFVCNNVPFRIHQDKWSRIDVSKYLNSITKLFYKNK